MIVLDPRKTIDYPVPSKPPSVWYGVLIAALAAAIVVVFSTLAWAQETNWKPGDEAFVRAICLDLAAMKNIAAGLAQSNEAADAAISAGVQSGRCGVLPMHVSVVLGTRVLFFRDYKGFQADLWTSEFNGDTIFFLLRSLDGPHKSSY